MSAAAATQLTDVKKCERVISFNSKGLIKLLFGTNLVNILRVRI
jgi:hypothetical protein